MSQTTLVNHEILHTCSLAVDFIDRNLLARDDLLPNVRAQVQQAFDAMFLAYQTMGLLDEENPDASAPTIIL